MIGQWFGRARLDLPLGRDASGRFLPWIVALMAYLAAMGGVGLIVLSDTLRAVDRSLASALTLQLPAEASAARIEMTLAVLRQTPGIVAAHVLEPAETARLLEPWLGPSVPLDRLPVPRLVDLRIDPDAAIDFAGLRQKLASIVPGARLDENRPALEDLRRTATRVEGVIAAAVAVVALLLVLSVVFTVRTGLAVHGGVIELLHLLGAGDGYLARQFQTHALRLGLLGGAIGALAALVTLFALRGAGGAVPLPAAFARPGFADWRLWAVLAGIAPAAGLVAMVAARVTVLRQLARMP